MDAKKKLLLVLDIDETLIYASETRLDRPPDFTTTRYSVYIRPHLEEFLSFCFENFSVGVWTSASASYAKVVLREIMPELHNHLIFVYSQWECSTRFDAELQNYYPRKPIKKLKQFG
jgi:TFIIF-interacting CTD phosphatase-like protein